MMEEQQIAPDVVDDVPAPVAPEAPQREWSDDDAQEAKAFGWKAPDEWEGEKPAGYIDDPRRYLERAENFRPFKALREQQERERAEQAERFRKLEAISAQTLAAEKARFERELAQLNARQRQAVEEADLRTFDHIQKVKDDLKPPPEMPQAAPVAPVQVDSADIVAKHEWVKDPTLLSVGRTIVDGRHDILRLSPAEQFAFADRELRRLYPSAFTPAPQPAPTTTPQTVSRVDGGGLAFGGGKASAFGTLPPEAKSAFKRFVDQGVFQDNDADRKRYADDYHAA